ncbi:MAG: protein kinase domain-containing protein, partial [Thermoleophilia bacterium]
MGFQDKRRFGPWRLEAKLGKGGNATVWRATRSDDEGPLALKVIDATKPTREQYQRFVREIGFLRSISDPDGVLPLIDAYLPEAPSKEDRPWLAMPIASRIDLALLGAPLEMVVEALRDIAHTLARLKAEAGVAHRDLKPTNLYELSGRWLVGDFGLLA